MNKSRKVLSGVLAALMLVSMLACFVLPAVAADDGVPNEKYYYVSTVNEWDAVANEINSNSSLQADPDIHIFIQRDIDFYAGKNANDEKVYYPLTQIEAFAGTLDGKGHKFSNIIENTSTNRNDSVTSRESGMIKMLSGTIQNLTFDSSCTFANTYSWDNYYSVNFGAFAASSDGGIIKKCASYATYVTDGTKTVVGGFVGDATYGVTIDGCIFDGTISANGKAGAFVGTPGANTIIKYSVAQGSLTAATPASDANCFTATSNSYAIVAEGGSYGNAPASQIKTDVKEAVYTINNQREQNVKDGIYLSVDENANANPCFGDAENRVVRVMTTNGTNSDPVYYAPRKLDGSNIVQNRFNASISGKAWEVQGAERHGNYIYIGHEDIEVTYHDTTLTSSVTGAKYSTEYKINQTKAQLQAMVDAYKAMDSAYFNGFAFEVSKNTWITKAENALKTKVEFAEIVPESQSPTDAEKTAEKERIAAIAALESLLQEIIKEEQNLEAYVIEMTDPEDYPSIQDYEIYKHVGSIKGYKIENAADWMKAVELSNYVENTNATNFAGITLHLAENIDMDSVPMKPLCYGGYFDGNLDGHGYAFENIKIEIDDPYGPVGLIGVLGEEAAGTVQNVGIESGSIKVTGQPRFKQKLSVSGKGNIVGGIVGKNYVNNTLIRKCWNNANITVENEEYVAGILGDGRNYAVIDSCINQGNSTGYGLLGYGHTRAKVYNSMSGAVHKQTVGYRGGITGIFNPYDTEVMPNEEYKTTAEYSNSLKETAIEAAMANYICNVSGVKLIVGFSAHTSGFSTEQGNAEKDYNFKYSVMSNAAAGWAVNAHYQRQESLGNGERIYYTLDANGDVRFGEESNQIHRIKMVCDQHGEACANHLTRYAYGVAGREITLGFDVEANYYACANENVTIKGNILTFSKEAVADENTFTVYVDYNADRGNVNGDGTINVLDALGAVRMVVYPNTAVLKTADVNSNHEVDILDAYQIIRHTLREMKGPNIPVDFVAGRPAETEDQYVKVLSYNVKGLYYDPTEEAAINKDQDIGAALSRKEEVLAELEAIDADIMGFQELIEGHGTYTADAHVLEEIYYGLSWADPLAIEEHMDYVPLRYYSDETGPTAGNGIISKYPILNAKTEYFAGLGQFGDDSKRLDDTMHRGFTCYQIDLNDNNRYEVGTDIIFCNAHLATTSDEVSAAEMQYILQYMKDNYFNDRVVLAGDMNLGAYHTEAVLENVSYTALNGGDNYSTYARTNLYSGSMVDNIIVSDNVEYFSFAESKHSGAPGLNTSAQLYDKNGNPVDGIRVTDTAWTASDHLPIWAYIKK